MPRLTAEQRQLALGMLEVGIRQDHVARHLGCTQGTISNLVRRFRQSGSVDDRSRSGRPRVTTVRQDRYIVLQHLRNRFHPASRTASTTIGTHRRPVSATTIRRRLRESGLRNRRPFRGPILTDRIRNRRLAWAEERLCWTFPRWYRILFTDESRFCLSVADGRRRVWRRRGERYARNCIMEFDRFGGQSVMVWGGINGNYRTELVVINIHCLGP